VRGFPTFRPGKIGVAGALSAATFQCPNHDVRAIVASLCGLLAFIGWKYSIQPDERDFVWPNPIVAAQDHLRRPIGPHWLKNR
jgi:hypothetical protein